MSYHWEQSSGGKHFYVADSGRIMVELWVSSLDQVVTVVEATEKDLKGQRFITLPCAMVAVEQVYINVADE